MYRGKPAALIFAASSEYGTRYFVYRVLCVCVFYRSFVCVSFRITRCQRRATPTIPTARKKRARAAEGLDPEAAPPPPRDDAAAAESGEPGREGQGASESAAHAPEVPLGNHSVRRNSVTVRVPATSANMGPGFDSIGMAVDMWNELTATRASDGVHKVTIEGEGAGAIPLDETNLIVVGAKAAFRQLVATRGLCTTSAKIESLWPRAWIKLGCNCQWSDGWACLVWP